VKTELALPPGGAARLAVLGSLVVGGIAALALAVLFAAFLVETLRHAGQGPR
jgi:hypothetical protein